MDSYLLDKKKGTKRHGLKVIVKNGCNVIVWCHILMCLKFLHNSQNPQRLKSCQ